MLSLERRPQDSNVMRWASPFLALLLTVITGWAMFVALQRDPWQGLNYFFLAPLSDRHGWAELGLKMSPLLLCASGLMVCYRTRVWNIGAEGQLLIGGLAASIAALKFGDSGGAWVLSVVLVAGVLGGTLWAMIASALRTQFHCSEILTTIMLNYIALNLLLYAVHGPLRDPLGFGFPQSAMFAPAALLPNLIPGTRLHIGLLFAFAAAVVVAVLFARTFIGFQLKVLGEDARAAAFAGFSSRRLIWICFLFSGGMAGLAGACEVAGPLGQLVPQISPGYGYTAIIVVFLGRMRAVGVVAASALLALTYMGGEMLQIAMNLPKAVTSLFQGLLLFYLLICDASIFYKVRWRQSSKARAISALSAVGEV